MALDSRPKPKKKFTIADAAKAYKKGSKPVQVPRIDPASQRSSYSVASRVPKKTKPMSTTYGGGKIQGNKTIGTTKYKNPSL